MPMEIDPGIAALLSGLDLGSAPDIATERDRGEAFAAAMAGRIAEAVPDDVAVRDIVIPGDVPLPARRYTPALDSTPRSGMVFAHGGGWTTGSPATGHLHVGAMAAASGVVILSIDYRLAPEHRFPAGLDDAVTAVRWVADHAEELGIDAGRLAIGGESAGANLMAAAAIVLRDTDGPPIALQLLEVPVLDLARPDTPSRREIKERFPALAAAEDPALGRYAGADPMHPLVSPLRAPDLAGLPPAALLAADVDPVRDDAVLYADRLRAAAVPVRLRVFPGIVHGTEGFTLVSTAAQDWLRTCVAVLRTMSIHSVDAA